MCSSRTVDRDKHPKFGVVTTAYLWVSSGSQGKHRLHEPSDICNVEVQRFR